MRSEDTRSDSRHQPRLTLLAGLAAAILLSPAAIAQVDCQLPGHRTPAVPVPECVDAQGVQVACGAGGSRKLWPPSGFHPASGFPNTSKRPRDTTDRFAGRTIPGAGSGHELFRSVDVVTVGGVSRRLYVAYNAGFQVWDIGSSAAAAADPVHLAYRDGWQGHFLVFPPVGEILNFVEDVAALDFNATSDAVAVAGLQPAGLSLWEFTPGTSALRQLYQDPVTSATQVRLIRRNNGTIYAFAGAENGLAVYNVSLAKNTTFTCDERLGQCAGVRRGFVGDTLNKSRIFIDALHLPASDLVLVSAAGGFNTFLELWLVDPQNPSTAQKIHGDALPLKHTLGSALFQYDGHTYLAVISENNGSGGATIDNEKLRIFMIDGCATGGACSLVEAVSPITVAPSHPTFKDFITHSEIGGTPYLYYGAQTSAVIGPALERLFDASSLRPPNPSPLASLPELTAGGATYVDPCNGLTMGYWSHYYQRNFQGLNEMYPQVGRFSEQGYFYRAANSILDVHLLGEGGGPESPAIRVDLSSTPKSQYWMGQDQVTVAATGSGGCNPSSAGWLWEEAIPNPNVTANLLSQSGNQRTYRFNCGLPSTRCADTTAAIEADNTDPSCVGATLTPLNIGPISDPRPDVSAMALAPSANPATYPVCTQLTFTPTVHGKTPLTYGWTVRRASDSEVVQTGNGTTLAWNTSGVEVGPSTQVFRNGFESGNFAGWLVSQGGSSLMWPATPAVSPKGAGGSADFAVELVLSNASGSDTFQETVTLTALDGLDFGSPAILATDLGDGAFHFAANALNATSWRWEIEDPGNGSSAGCLFFNQCVVLTGSAIDHVWAPPNVPGTYGVAVTASNCQDTTGISRQTTVTVDEVVTPLPPTVTNFFVDLSASPDCAFSLDGTFPCKVNKPITFTVQTTNSPSNLEFDWDGNGTWDETLSAAASIQHTYTQAVAFAFQPKVRAKSGALASAAQPLSSQLVITN